MLVNLLTLTENKRKNLNRLELGESKLPVPHINRSGRSALRATYFHDLQKYIVTMPSHIHEAPIDHISFRLQSAVISMPLQFGDYNVMIRYHNNSPIKVQKNSMIPDIYLTISGGGGADPYLKIPSEIFFFECAFSETKAHAKRKLRYLVASNPKAIGAMMINISETRHSLPSPDSTIAKAHIGELVSKDRWLPISSRDNRLSASYEGIQLLDVKSIDVFVWMRDLDADTPIDFDNCDDNVYATGVRILLYVSFEPLLTIFRPSIPNDRLQTSINYS